MADHATVWDRLYDPVTYTGVYSERFRDGPGINQDTDARVWKQRTSFQGYTNTATDEVVRDIADVTRPYLNPFPRERVVSPRERRISAVRERAQRGESAEAAFPLDANTQLQLIFQYYCKFGRTGARGDSESTIDSFNFMRFARECPGMLDSRLDRAEVDLIFTKCRCKGRRRLEYREFLDALSAMAITKFPAEDPITAFSLLLSHHVFNCAPAVGLREARAMQARSRAIREEAAASAAAEAEDAEHAAAAAAAAAAAGGNSGSGHPSSSYWAHETAAHAAELRERADTIARVAHSSPAEWLGFQAPPAGHLPAERPYRDSRIAAHVGSTPALAPPPPSARNAPGPPPTNTPPRPGNSASASASSSSSGAAPPPFMSPTTASAIDEMRRVEDLAAERAAARAVGAAQASRVPPPALPASAYAGDSMPAGQWYPPYHHAPAPHHDSASSSYSYPYPSSSSSSSAMAAASAARSPPGSQRRGTGLFAPRASSSAIAAAMNPDDPLEPLPRDERFRGRVKAKESNYKLGSPRFRPTLAGQANRPGSVFDRLSNPTNFTGVYRRAYFTDGRMNAYADTGVSSIPSRFVGGTNTGSNETIHNISVTLRPGLRTGGTFR